MQRQYWQWQQWQNAQRMPRPHIRPDQSSTGKTSTILEDMSRKVIPPPPPPPQACQGSDTMCQGTVRRLFPGKGFGFVSRDESEELGLGAEVTNEKGFDVFLHFSDLVPGLGSAELQVGSRVSFLWESADPHRGPGGRARRVSLDVSEVPPHPAVVSSADHSKPATAPAPRPRATGRVYRRDALLTMEEVMRRNKQLCGARPGGVPRLLQMPHWYWEDDDRESQDAPDDESRLRALEARLDRENGADARNVETFGEAWAGEVWTFEEALAANQRLARAQGLAVPYEFYESRSQEQMIPMILQ
ncbi:unnamed protein product [Effrenium voratum]|nr:unnamed protein product [Effrenium voratum]